MEHRKCDGSVVVQEGPNLVVTTGLNHIADRLVDASPPARISHFAVGDGGVTPELGQTTLQGTEHGRAAISTWFSLANEISVNGIFTAAGTITCREIGVFNAAAAGTMFARFLMQEAVMAATETLNIQWALRIGTGAV